MDGKGILTETLWNTKSIEKIANLPTDVPWYVHAADLYAGAKANAEKGEFRFCESDMRLLMLDFRFSCMGNIEEGWS